MFPVIHYSILLLSFFFVSSVMAQEEVQKHSSKEQYEEPKVVEYQLDNGLKILVKPIFRAPVVSSQLWYKVGSSYEHSGISGISHMLEHMMFKGTKKYPGNAISNIVAKLGGNQNAFTSRDYTAYYQNISAQHLEKMLELEADRMQGIVWNEEEFKSEVKVVIEERRLRTDDNIDRLLYEQFFTHSFNVNPYRIPVIGWMDDIKHYKMQNAQQWFAKWYTPNNATLVVVGAVEPERVRQLATKYFSAIGAHEIAEIKPRIEPALSLNKRIEMTGEVNYNTLVMGYRVPTLGLLQSQDELLSTSQKKELFALELISAILDSGGSSRLHTALVRKQQVASQSGAFYNLYSRLENLFVLEAVTATGYKTADIEKAIIAQIELLKNEKVPDEELQKVKNQLIASSMYHKDSLFNQGYELGALESIGLSWRDGRDYLEQVKAVSAEDIMAASRKYFVPKNLSVAVLKPKQEASEEIK